MTISWDSLEKNDSSKVIIHFRKITKNIQRDDIKQSKIYQKEKKATKEGKGGSKKWLIEMGISFPFSPLFKTFKNIKRYSNLGLKITKQLKTFENMHNN